MGPARLHAWGPHAVHQAGWSGTDVVRAHAGDRRARNRINRGHPSLHGGIGRTSRGLAVDRKGRPRLETIVSSGLRQQVSVFPDIDALSRAAAERFVSLSRTAIRSYGR